MPKSKKPRKPYRKKYASGQLPVVFRHSSEAELMLQMIPHDDLEKLRTGLANEYTVNTLAFRINWGYIMSNEIFDSQEVRDSMKEGLDAIRQIQARHDRAGKFGASGPELVALGEALALTDEMQKKATRREHKQCLDALYLLNEQLKETK